MVAESFKIWRYHYMGAISKRGPIYPIFNSLISKLAKVFSVERNTCVGPMWSYILNQMLGRVRVSEIVLKPHDHEERETHLADIRIGICGIDLELCRRLLLIERTLGNSYGMHRIATPVQ